MSTTLITRATILNEGKQIQANLLIRDEQIEKIIPRADLPFTRIDNRCRWKLPYSRCNRRPGAFQGTRTYP